MDLWRCIWLTSSTNDISDTNILSSRKKKLLAFFSSRLTFQVSLMNNNIFLKMTVCVYLWWIGKVPQAKNMSAFWKKNTAEKEQRMSLIGVWHEYYSSAAAAGYLPLYVSWSLFLPCLLLHIPPACPLGKCYFFDKGTISCWFVCWTPLQTDFVCNLVSLGARQSLNRWCSANHWRFEI